MQILTFIIKILPLAALLVLLVSYICYRLCFYAKREEYAEDGPIEIPKGKIYEPFRGEMTEWIREMRAMPYELMHIVSHDGLDLYARYFEFAPGAPIEIMFHGYRGSAERDLAGGVQRAAMLGRSVLLVDQRCAGRSGGKVISFGINEHQDCLGWVKFACEHFGPEAKFILTGISMGASTVLMTADKELPENVVGILADCGYTTARDIIRKVIRQIGLPAWFFYPLVKLGARIYGHFDLESDSALQAVRAARVPIIFFHGENDDFVPCEMSRENFEACVSRKMLVTIPGAGHGLCYPTEPERYLSSLREFFGSELSHPSVR